MKCDINPPPVRWGWVSPFNQATRGALTYMGGNPGIPQFMGGTLWNRGFVDTNGKYYELWNAQAQYYTE